MGPKERGSLCGHRGTAREGVTSPNSPGCTPLSPTLSPGRELPAPSHQLWGACGQRWLAIFHPQFSPELCCSAFHSATLY